MDNVREEIRQEEIKKISTQINDEYNIEKIRELIRSNKKEFIHNDKTYRVRLLNDNEKDELNILTKKRLNSMIQEKDEKGNYVWLHIAELIKIYKERGTVDIEKIDSGINKATKKFQSANFELGEALANKAGENFLKSYKEELEQSKSELESLIIEKGHYLESSVEQQIQNYNAKCISYLCLDVKEENSWIRAFKSIDDFIKADDKLVNLASLYAMALHFGV